MTTKWPNLIYSLCAITISIFLWMLFKHYYPYPNLTFDSYHYVMNMHLKTEAAGWPVGYSKLIGYLGYISHSANLIVTIQFFIIQIGFLIFFISFRLFFNPGKTVSIILFLFLFINPINIFGSNHILSDPLYIGICMIWISQLLWILFRFHPFMILTQAILILILFDLRYNALYYPIITAFTFIVARINWKWKAFGIAFTVILLGYFIQYTSIQMEKMSGVKQYAYSNGWKQASNGLYIYEHYYKNEPSEKSARFGELDSMVRAYFDKPHPDVSLLYPDKEITLGSYYMAVGGTPLYSYMQKKSGFTDWSLDFHRTAPYGPLYRAYGNYLIFNHPLGYLRYVVYPHMVSYLIPYPEIFTENPDAFSLWNDNQYGKIARDWFKLTTIKIPDRYIQFRAWLLSPYTFIYTIIHILFLLTLISFIVFKGFRLTKRLHLFGLSILLLLCIGNFVFTILSTTSVLRYQPGVIAIELTLILYFIEFILQFDITRHPLDNVSSKKQQIFY